MVTPRSNSKQKTTNHKKQQQSDLDREDSSNNHETSEGFSPENSTTAKKGKKSLNNKKGNQKDAQESTKVRAPSSQNKKARIPVHKRLNLYFPVGRIGRYLRRVNSTFRVGRTTPVFIAAVLDYMVGELIEIGSDAAENQKKSIVRPRHFQHAIREDRDFLNLLGPVVMTNGGQGGMVSVHPGLFGSRSIRKKTSNKPDKEGENEDVDERENDEKTEREEEDMKSGRESSDSLTTSYSGGENDEDEELDTIESQEFGAE